MKPKPGEQIREDAGSQYRFDSLGEAQQAIEMVRATWRFLDEHAHVFERRPVDDGSDKLAKAARQADKAWRDAEEKTAASSALADYIKPDGPEEITAETMHRFVGETVVVMTKGVACLAKVGERNKTTGKWPLEMLTNDSPSLVQPFPYPDVEVLRWYPPSKIEKPEPHESPQEHAKDAMQKRLSAAVDAIDEVFDTPQETEPGDELVEALERISTNWSENPREEADTALRLLAYERARNAKRVAELEAELELAGQSVTESYEDELTALRERIAELESKLDPLQEAIRILHDDLNMGAFGGWPQMARDVVARVRELESQLEEAGKREEFPWDKFEEIQEREGHNMKTLAVMGIKPKADGYLCECCFGNGFTCDGCGHVGEPMPRGFVALGYVWDGDSRQLSGAEILTELDTLRRERDELNATLERIERDTLGLFAKHGVCTPAEGFRKAGWWSLRRAIEDIPMAASRDILERAETADRLAEVTRRFEGMREAFAGIKIPGGSGLDYERRRILGDFPALPPTEAPALVWREAPEVCEESGVYLVRHDDSDEHTGGWFDEGEAWGGDYDITHIIGPIRPGPLHITEPTEPEQGEG